MCHLNPTENIKRLWHIQGCLFRNDSSRFWKQSERGKENAEENSLSKKGMSKKATTQSPQVSQKRIKRKREIDEALQVEKPKKVIHLMIYPVHGIILWSYLPITKIQNMLTEMVKDRLGRQVWRNANMKKTAT